LNPKMQPNRNNYTSEMKDDLNDREEEGSSNRFRNMKDPF